VLRKARDGNLGLFSGLATAAARWRPRSLAGRRGKGRRGPALRGVGPGGHWGAAWGGGRSGRWPAALLGGGQRRSAPAAEEAGREGGGR
jgi:hypothetical protein